MHEGLQHSPHEFLVTICSAGRKCSKSSTHPFVLGVPQNLGHLGVCWVLAQHPHHISISVVQVQVIACSIKQLAGLLEFCGLDLGEVTHLGYSALWDLFWK